MSTINSYSDIFRRDTLGAKLSEIDNTIYVKEVELSSAQILDLFNTPVEIVAAEAGYCFEFVGAMVIYEYGTATYTGGGTVDIYQTNTGNNYAATLAAAQITAANDTLNFMPPLSTVVNYDVVSANDGIAITNNTAVFANGDGVIRLKVAYRKHATGL